MLIQPEGYSRKNTSMAVFVSCIIDHYIKSKLTCTRLSFTKSGREVHLVTCWKPSLPGEMNNVCNRFRFQSDLTCSPGTTGLKSFPGSDKMEMSTV